MKTLNTFKKQQRSQGGFTIIELVVVILLLGILTATALPRFLDVTDSAHDAVVQGVLGGLNTGIGLYRAQWVANGQPPNGNGLTGFGAVTAELLTPNGSGYPVGLSGAGLTLDESDCRNIFIGLLQNGRPSSVSASAAAAAAAATTAAGSTGVDFTIHPVGTASCKFVYVAQGPGASYPVIDYDPVTGAVTLNATEL
ncbi:MAG: prepilin-type N-terminal cleavage/methylation domain-containing protein [Pseudohongiella sp.]|nr:prepilin-type N-terminal cleavage/methylation domain-containing protein [Pseudohongiella sp.]